MVPTWKGNEESSFFVHVMTYFPFTTQLTDVTNITTRRLKLVSLILCWYEFTTRSAPHGTSHPLPCQMRHTNQDGRGVNKNWLAEKSLLLSASSVTIGWMLRPFIQRQGSKLEMKSRCLWRLIRNLVANSQVLVAVWYTLRLLHC